MTPRWWLEAEGGARCLLCFRGCLIPSGATGLCGVRGFDAKTGFVSPFLGRFSACAVDPVEKKPFYHWRPGTRIFSLGSVGCNMRCPFCQNHGIAQPIDPSFLPVVEISPTELVRKVQDAGLRAVAYTYNEPTLQAEYILEAAPLLDEARIAAALVSNGMFSQEAARDLAPCLDAANIDVKTFDAAHYRKLGGDLETVKKNVEYLLAAGVHVELTALIVPGVSDAVGDFDNMVAWIASLSPQLPLHISRYFPAFRYTAPPTGLELMKKLLEVAEKRLAHVHLGNVR